MKRGTLIVFILITLLSLTVPAGLARTSEAEITAATSTNASPFAGFLKGPSSGGGIVASIVKAPIIPDGTTAGAATDFVITLDTSLDPSVPGRTLLQGRTIRITLPEAFEYVDPVNFPIGDAGGSPDCAPGNLQCSTGVILQGWPQHPIAPPFLNYSLSYEASTNSIVYTALTDLIPNPPFEPGIKQMHLLILGFRNPGPGNYRVYVEAETGPGGAVETGWGNVRIVPKSRPSINVTSALNPGTPNTIYQTTAPNQPTPLPYDFLLWDWRNEPLLGASLERVNPSHSRIVKDGETVGHVFIDAPKGATGFHVADTGPSVPFNSPVLVVPTALLTVNFTAGSDLGRYVVTFSLNGGNALQMFVDVE